MSLKRIILVILSLLYVIATFYIIGKDGVSLDSILPVLFFGVCLLVFIFEDKIFNWVNTKKANKVKATYCEFKEDAIYFPKGYYFKHGYLKQLQEIKANRIDDIRINTNPISAKINDNEIIFLLGATKADVQSFAEKCNIPIIQPTDNWALICEEFLDTDESEDFKKKTLAALATVGISPAETIAIRKKISRRMLVNTYFSMEWIYYGQYDVLHQFFPLRKELYWWTMEIALRKSTK